MNKQKVIDQLKESLSKMIENIEDENDFNKGYRYATQHCFDIIKQLDEPEKPVLSKEEVVWLVKLQSFYKQREDQLYVATRQGWGSDFEFSMYGKNIVLPYTSYKGKESSEYVKRRLVNAILYGYEVEKEKVYTVEIPNPNGDGCSKTFLGKIKEGKVELCKWSCYTSIEFADNWKQEEYAQLTEAEIKEDFPWAWQLAEEVEK